MILHGDVASLPFDDETFTAVLTDPPYGLQFMGKSWDHGVPSVAMWREVWRVCKPGAIMLAFGGTRTWHRLATAIEDAGWGLCDTLMWLYGAGLPKSHDISKAIDREAGAERKIIGRYQPPNGTTWNLRNDKRGGGLGAPSGLRSASLAITAPATPDAVTWAGYGTALRPSFEPILFCRKPREGTYVRNAIKHRAGVLNVDGGRIKNDSSRANAAPVGRWPSNSILDEAAAEMVGEQSGESYRHASENRAMRGANTERGMSPNGYADTGTAARFFQHCSYSEADDWPLRFMYTSKAGRAERDAGLEEWPLRNCGMMEDDAYPIKTGSGNLCKTQRHNHHPTVKPLALCRYLATLIRPPEAYLDDAALLVPFAGSGSEVIGGYLAGWRNVVGVELEAEYVEIANAREAWWRSAMAETGLSDPKEVLNAMTKRRRVDALALRKIERG